tara:strand:- start:3547 stop:3684 length:138 start_codon:yes stop_codon:yes gene_type:complete
MNYDLNPFEGLCFLYYEMAHAGGCFDDNKNDEEDLYNLVVDILDV